MFIIELTDAQASDLFFNYEKPGLSAAYASEAEPEEIERELEASAKEFSALTGIPVAWLVSDYNARV